MTSYEHDELVGIAHTAGRSRRVGEGRGDVCGSDEWARMCLLNACRTKQTSAARKRATSAARSHQHKWLLLAVHAPALVQRMCELGIGLKTMKYIGLGIGYDGDAVTQVKWSNIWCLSCASALRATLLTLRSPTSAHRYAHALVRSLEPHRYHHRTRDARLLHVLGGITHASKRDYSSSTSSSAAVRSRLRVAATAAAVLALKTAASVRARNTSAEHEATR